MERYSQLLTESQYNEEETQFLVDGFTNGFDIGYRGPEQRQSTSANIPFTVGDKFQLWDKIMKEVEAKRFAGPFEEIPFKNYIQSPVGLVPKKGGKTRLIFHLSFNFKKNSHSDTSNNPEQNCDGEGDCAYELPSVNRSTPREWCSVRYNDLDTAIKYCILLSERAEFINGVPIIFMGKTDLSNAFRVLPLKKGSWCWLVLKAEDPNDGKIKFFIDKCLPFGASISCSHYQRFSNSLKHILLYWDNIRSGSKASLNREVTNYLDDFPFIAILKCICDKLISLFMELCDFLNIPIAVEKTEWGTSILVFLGILLNGKTLSLGIPLDKQIKALNLLNDITSKKKATIRQIQTLTGYLNFLMKAIHAGRMFTRHMYSKCQQMEFSKSGKHLKHYHHIRLDQEFKFDCEVWKLFLTHFREASVCRPMVDYDRSTINAKQLQFFTDASASSKLGVGAFFNGHWFYQQWENNYIKLFKPSIEYLELYGVVSAILTWGHLVRDLRFTLFCDNESVVEMINSQVSRCKNCMYLIRLLILNNLVNNRKVYAKHLRSAENYLADSLSRLQLSRFWKLAPPHTDKNPTKISPLVWPASQIWQK